MDNITNSKFLTSVWKGSRKVDDEGFVWEKAEEGEFMRYIKNMNLHKALFAVPEQTSTSGFFGLGSSFSEFEANLASGI